LAGTTWDLIGNTLAGTEFLGSTNGQPLVIKTSNTEWARFDISGRLGLGTDSPVERFHVHNGAIRITGTVPGEGGPMVLLGGTPNGTAPAGEWGIEYEPNALGLNFWRPFGSSGAGFANYVLFLSNSNRVGVNTNNPTAQFTVNGKTLIGHPATVTLPGTYNLYVQNGILTDKIKVATVNSSDWSDYVFDEDYALRSIDDVEIFVRTNRHLPDVPSADEVRANGVDLVEINAALLRKIEELTLYTIDLNRRLEMQEARLHAMDITAATGRR